jgi:hypothetical protein
MAKRIARAWSFYRHGVAIKGLLQALGIWKWVVLGAETVMSVALAYWFEWSAPLRILIGLISLAVMLLITGFAVALYKTRDIPSEKTGIASDENERTGEPARNVTFHGDVTKSQINATLGDQSPITVHNAPLTIREIPSESMNGINTDFKLSHTPKPGSLVVLLNGIDQDGWFTLNGNTITFKVPPHSSDDMKIKYDQEGT